MSTCTVRMVIYNNNEVMLQRRSWGRLSNAILICVPFVTYLFSLSSSATLDHKVALTNPWFLASFLSWVVIFLSPWRDWKLLDNEVYAQRAKLKNLGETAIREETKLSKLESALKEKKKQLLSPNKNRKGVSEPFKVQIKSSDLFYKRYPDLDDPKTTWQDYFNMKKLKGSSLEPTLRERLNMGDGKTKGRPQLQAVVPEEYKQYSIQISDQEQDVGDVDSYRSPPPKKDRGKNNPRNRRKGETDQEYRDRMSDQND